MKRLFVGLVLAAVSGCGGRPAPAETDRRAHLPLPTMEAVRAALEERRAPLPDRRVVAAFAELHHFVTRWTLATPDVARANGGFRVTYYDKDVGTVPARATFADAMRLLVRWSTTVGKPLVDTPAPTTPFELLSDDEAIELLGRVQGEQTLTRRGLHDAARALVSLAAFREDPLGFGDGLVARALAAVALDRAHGADTARQEALLADAMGYGVDAKAIAETLPVTDPVRAYVLGDEATLARATTTTGRFLAFRSAQRRGDASAARRRLGALQLSPAVLSVRLATGDDANGDVGRALFATALLGATLDTGVAVAAKARADVVTLGSQSDPAPSRITAAVYGWLGIQRVEGLSRLESELAHVGEHDVGPFFDRAARQELLRLDAVNALHAIALRSAKDLLPEAAEAAFAGEVGAATGALADALRTFHRALVDCRRDDPPRTFTSIDALGPVSAFERLAAASRFSADDYDLHTEGARVATMLDGRPSHRRMLAQLARWSLLDRELERRSLADADALSGPRAVAIAPQPTGALRGDDARALAAIGKRDEAEAAARAASVGAPELEAIALVAEVLVRAGDAKGAAKELARAHARSLRILEVTVGASFAAATAAVGDEGARAAVGALHDAAVPPDVRRALARAVATHDAKLAAAMYEGLALDVTAPLSRFDVAGEAFPLVVETRGRPAATAFVDRFRSAEIRALDAPIAYAHGLAIEPAAAPFVPVDAIELSHLLALATPDALRNGVLRDAARAHFAAASGSRFVTIGRRLTGLDGDEIVRLAPRTNAERCEIAFYLARLADAEKRDDDASALLQLALDVGDPDVAEWRWASRWARARLDPQTP